MKKFVIALALGLVFAMSLATTYAQDALVVGETVTGSISNSAPEVAYTYTAKEGEILVLELFAVDFSTFSSLTLKVNDGSDTEIVSYDTYGVAPVYVQFPADAEYTIIATRYDESEGDFSLRAVSPTELKVEEPVSQDKKYGEKFYYTYTGEEDVNLVYVRDGVLALDVTVNVFSEFLVGTLDEKARVGGELATQGTVGVIPGGSTYIIVVEEPLFTFASDTDTVTFQVGLTAAK